jgi:hypothetical protein
MSPDQQQEERPSSMDVPSELGRMRIVDFARELKEKETERRIRRSLFEKMAIAAFVQAFDDHGQQFRDELIRGFVEDIKEQLGALDCEDTRAMVDRVGDEAIAAGRVA